MPIAIGAEIRRLDDREFGEVVFETMRNVFAVHNELGRFFDEKIYHREIAFRMAGAQIEVPIDVTFDVTFDGFCKRYFIDLLVGGRAIFELKTVQSLADRHRSQLMHYLSLTALKVTALDADGLPEFECHARRFLAHASLRAIQWINIARPVVQFKTLK